MTIVSSLLRRRRLLLLCALTLALHLVAIDWLATRIGAVRPRPPKTEPSLISAQLHLALPARTPDAAPPPEIAPLAHAPVKRIHAPAPPAVTEAPPPADASPAADAGVAAMPDLAPPDDAASTAAAAANPAAANKAAASTNGAAANNAADNASTAAAQAAPATAPPAGADPAAATPPPAPTTGVHRYKVHLPPSADFALDVKRVDANGSVWNGDAAMMWRSDGSRYKVTVEAGIKLLVRINLLVLTSEGSIDDYGIAPDTATEKRAGHAQTATHFNRDAGTISFSASEQSFPLLAGAQDEATVPFQLGGIGHADVNQFSSAVDILVGEDRTANLFRFQLVGEETLDTKMGRIVTWHLSRPPRPGSYSSRLDIWLAPGMNWYPIQIRNTEASGALTTQTVTNITENRK